MPSQIVLVRHCESAVNPETPPSTWGLTSRGLQQAKSLVRLVKQPMIVVAGDEPKMVQSVQPLAEAAGLEVHAESDLSETHSEGWFGDDEFFQVIQRFFEAPASPPAPGWEAADVAADRFVHRLLEIATDSPPEGRVVACSGGRALTAALHRMDLLPSERLYSAWKGIQMPDVAQIAWENDRPTLHTMFGSTRGSAR